ncbi:uncharacterized protein [Battus philenor]|uniref:uncharacterized protein n=1 Tax=Battus philenor TaxID=42288 RepID=UPI0035D0F9C2
MWRKILVISFLFKTIFSEVTIGGIDRTMSEGVKSLGYKIIYGQDDIEEINEVIKDTERMKSLKSKVNINEAAPPLPPQDVKCLMSTDNYCTRDMFKTKGILIQAMKNDCAKCSKKEKDRAGRIIASMMAHDPVAWKMFLTRYAIITKLDVKPVYNHPKQEPVKFKLIGYPEEIEKSENRFISPGASVRVKRYLMEKV